MIAFMIKRSLSFQLSSLSRAAVNSATLIGCISDRVSTCDLVSGKAHSWVVFFSFFCLREDCTFGPFSDLSTSVLPSSNASISPCERAAAAEQPAFFFYYTTGKGVRSFAGSVASRFFEQLLFAEWRSSSTFLRSCTRCFRSSVQHSLRRIASSVPCDPDSFSKRAISSRARPTMSYSQRY